MIEEKYKELCEQVSDINEHLPTLKKYASECEHITEFGVRWVVSTWALLAAKPKTLVSYDIHYHPNIEKVKEYAVDTTFEFRLGNVLEMNIEETDLLFIDTWHVYDQLKAELDKHALKVKKYIILHDTYTFGTTGEGGKQGLQKAIDEFLSKHNEWKIKEVYTNNNGLTILEKGEWDKTIRTDKMKFIVPIPDNKYYLWQQLVQITNFREMGYEEELHIPVIYFKDTPSETLIKLSESKDLNCHWHLYADRREKKGYSASMKPHLMGRYFEEFPGERNYIYNYLDADCIFTKPMDFTPFLVDNNVWYGSDTKGYTGEDYIKGKGTQLFYDLCNIVGVDPSLMENKTGWEIGAQYFIKNNTAELWFEIEDKSVDAYIFMKETKDKYHPKGHEYPIQAWCSEMYVTQMVALKHGICLEVSPLMDFHWANHNIRNWYTKPYFHNAGQVKDNGKDFCKTLYQSSPFKKDIKIIPTSASYNYLQLIRKTEDTFPDLLWD